MSSPRRESPRVRQKQREAKRWREYYKKHKKRILSMKPTISGTIHNDQYEYLHVQLRLKKLQLEEDRFSTIDYENRKLLERIINIVGDIPTAYDSSQRVALSPRKLPEDKTIEKQNAKILERIEKIKPYISSSTASPAKIIEARDKLRRKEEQKIMEENKNLKDRIDAARNRLNLTPPIRYSMHTSFNERYEVEAKELDSKNLKMRDRLESILRSGPTFEMENPNPVIRRNKAIKSYSADNREMKKRLENIKATIDVNKNQEPQYHPRSSNPRAEEERIIRENQELQRRILKIMSSQKPLKKAEGSKESPRKKQVEAWTKAIEKENKILLERLKVIKPVMSTRCQDTSSKYVPYDDPYKEQNQHMRERIAKIKRGEVPSPLNQTKDSQDENEETQEEAQNEREDTKKKKKKTYKTPAGYHKKFRKKQQKATKKTRDGGDEDNSDLETDTSDSD